MKLIKNEDGTIRRCDRNIKELGYWRSLRWFGYKSCLNYIDISELFKAIQVLSMYMFYILFFPILPLIAGYVNWRRAVRICKLEDS